MQSMSDPKIPKAAVDESFQAFLKHAEIRKRPLSPQQYAVRVEDQVHQHESHRTALRILVAQQLYYNICLYDFICDM